MWVIRPTFILMACAALAGARRIVQQEQALTLEEVETEMLSAAVEQAASESNTSGEIVEQAASEFKTSGEIVEQAVSESNTSSETSWKYKDHRFCIDKDTDLVCSDDTLIVVKSAYYNRAKKDVWSGETCTPAAPSPAKQDDDSCKPRHTAYFKKECDGQHTCTLRVQNHKSCVTRPWTFMRVTYSCVAGKAKPKEDEIKMGKQGVKTTTTVAAPTTTSSAAGAPTTTSSIAEAPTTSSSSTTTVAAPTTSSAATATPCMYTHYTGYAVPHSNFAEYTGQTVQSCKGFCDASTSCLGIDYATSRSAGTKAYWPSGTCKLQSATNRQYYGNSDGWKHLDFYLKGSCQAPTTSSTTELQASQESVAQARITNGKGNVAAGTECKIPFSYKGKIYNDCVGTYGGYGWCSAGSFRYEDKSKWGGCAAPTQNDEVCQPAVSTTIGRCGPGYGRCNRKQISWAVYCNTANGWCGITAAHRDAQAHDTYDWEPQACAQAATLAEPDQSKCADRGSDCCASERWGEKQSCANGYIAKADADPASHCSSLNSDCKNYDRGIGCYACYPQ